jgi:transposase-like protein
MLNSIHPPADCVDSLKKDAALARALGSGLTDEIRSRAVALRERGSLASEIASAIGVHDTTLYGWVRSGRYKSPFRSVAIEPLRIEQSACDSVAFQDRASWETAAPALLRIRYPRGTRVSFPMAQLSPEILSALLSIETSR